MTHLPRYVVLTGAGFSRDFGGLLTREMTFRVYSSSYITSSDIRQKLAESGNYETVLSEYQNAGRTKLADELLAGIAEAFEFQESILHVTYGHPDITVFKEFLDGCSTAGGVAIYSLNHDTLLELCLPQALKLPGAHQPSAARSRITPDQFSIAACQSSPDYTTEYGTLSNLNRVFPYRKLHGSINWRRNDGLPIIVAGSNKPHQIGELPPGPREVVGDYHKRFELDLSSAGWLISIGYSYGDAHINQCILKGKKRIVDIDPDGVRKLIPERSGPDRSLPPEGDSSRLLSMVEIEIPMGFGHMVGYATDGSRKRGLQWVRWLGERIKSS